MLATSQAIEQRIEQGLDIDTVIGELETEFRQVQVTAEFEQPAFSNGVCSGGHCTQLCTYGCGVNE